MRPFAGKPSGKPSWCRPRPRPPAPLTAGRNCEPAPPAILPRILRTSADPRASAEPSFRASLRSPARSSGVFPIGQSGATALGLLSPREMRHPLRVTKTSISGVVAVAVGFFFVVAGCSGASRSASLRWSSPTSVAKGFDLLFVSCPESRFCVGLGETEEDLTLKTVVWDGSRWRNLSSGPGLNPPGVGELSCGSPTFCLAVNASDSWEWNGKHWSGMLAPPGSNIETSTPELAAVSCTSANTCMALSSTEAYHFADGRWANPVSLPALPSPSGPITQDAGQIGISCPTSTSCTAIEGNGFEYHWNGREWQTPLDALPPNNEYVACPQPKWCMYMNSQSYEAIDSDGHWSGPTFVDPESMALGQPAGETSPVSWGQADYGVLGLACGSPTLCVAVDDAGYAVTFNGKTWSRPTAVDTGGDNLETVTCAPSVCMALDDFGVVIGRV